MQLSRPRVYDRPVQGPQSLPIILLLIVYGLAGVAIGVAVGGIMSLVLKTKLRLRKVGADAALAAAGFIVGMVAVAFVPWRPHTVTYISADTVVTTTTYRYQHPYYVAVTLAILVPLASELYSFSRSRKAPIVKES